jgi:hypothetical protein
MKLLVNANVYGWTMTGLLGDGGAWFLGHSKRPTTTTLVLSDTPDGGLAISLDGPGEGRAANIARNLLALLEKGAAVEAQTPKAREK